VTGLLVPPRDPQALALRLCQLLINPELRAAMGQAARQRVEREFTWDIAARRFAALYESLASEQCPPAEHPQPTTWERVVGDAIRW
jgi:glycosyltransferase involved in cell wall biosynthesis